MINHPGMDGLNFRLRRAEVDSARHEREAASYKVELAQIRLRMAELISQHEPLHALCSQSESRDQRDAINSAVFYVVVGRWEREA